VSFRLVSPDVTDTATTVPRDPSLTPLIGFRCLGIQFWSRHSSVGMLVQRPARVVVCKLQPPAADFGDAGMHAWARRNVELNPFFSARCPSARLHEQPANYELRRLPRWLQRLAVQVPRLAV